ncbi:hypothetical protein K438DRAFT_1957265 [Mycena galopus ATCC 62051]|nr:hypothetical protein K438DRAFT_1957265 [Mycena galopus ATCC 62051]
MFFSRALFVSISLASLLIPGALAVSVPLFCPQASRSPDSVPVNDVGFEARTNTAAVVTAGQTVLTNIQNVVDKANELKAANLTAAAPAISKLKSVLVSSSSVLPSNGYLGGGGAGALSTGVWVVPRAPGLVNLLDEILNGILDGLISPLLDDVCELLDGLLTCRSNCGCGDGLDEFIQELVTLMDELLESLTSVASVSQGCGCGYDAAVLQQLQPTVTLMVGLVVVI